MIYDDVKRITEITYFRPFYLYQINSLFKFNLYSIINY